MNKEEILQQSKADSERQDAVTRVSAAASEPNDKGNMAIVARKLGGRYIEADGMKIYDAGQFRDDVPPSFPAAASAAVQEELVAREVEARSLLNPHLDDEEYKKRNAEYKTIRAWRIKSGMGTHMDHAPKHAKSHPVFARDPAKLDPRLPLLNARNCVVNLARGHVGERLEHSPEFMFTKRAGSDFIPDATCRNFTAALEYALPAAEREFLKRYFGQAMEAERSEKMVEAVGQSRTGKSTILNGPLAVLGDFALLGNPDLLLAKTNKSGEDASPFLSDLAGMRFVGLDETSRDSRLAGEILKRITGTKIRIRKLYSNPFYVDLQASYMLSTNFKLDVDGADDAVFERLYVLRFENVIPKPHDPQWFEKNVVGAGELPGILNWMLEGLKDYHEQGFNPPESVRAATLEYQQETDIVGQWIEQCTKPAPGGLMKSAPAFRNSFVKFRSARGGRHINEKEWRDRILTLSYTGNKTTKERFPDGDRCMAFTGIEMDDANVYADEVGI